MQVTGQQRTYQPSRQQPKGAAVHDQESLQIAPRKPGHLTDDDADDAVKAALLRPTIGGSAEQSSQDRRAIYLANKKQQNKDEAAANLAKKKVFQAQQKEATAADIAKKKAELEQLHAKGSMPSMVEIPVIKKQIMDNKNRILSLQRANRRFLSAVENAPTAKDAATSIVFINMDRRRVKDNTPFHDEALGAKVSEKNLQEWDKFNRDLLTTVDYSQNYVLARDSVTGTVMPITRKLYNDFASQFVDINGRHLSSDAQKTYKGGNTYARYVKANPDDVFPQQIPSDQLPNIVREAAIHIQKREIQRNEKTIKMIESENEQLIHDVKSRESNRLNYLNVPRWNKPSFSDEAELDSTDDSLDRSTSPSGYHVNDDIAVSIEIDA